MPETPTSIEGRDLFMNMNGFPDTWTHDQKSRRLSMDEATGVINGPGGLEKTVGNRGVILGCGGGGGFGVIKWKRP